MTTAERKERNEAVRILIEIFDVFLRRLPLEIAKEFRIGGRR